MNLRRKLKKLKLNQKGQGLTELILLMIIVVGIIIGSVYQFNDAFKNFADNYFGNYIACLLESGELPALKSEEGSSGVCNSNYEDFSFQSGRPLAAGSATTTGGGGPTSSARSRRRGDAISPAENAQASGNSFAVGGSTPAAESAPTNLTPLRGRAPIIRQRPTTFEARSKSYTGDTSSTTANMNLQQEGAGGSSRSFEDYDQYYDGDPDQQKRERQPTAVKSSTKQQDENGKKKVALMKVNPNLKKAIDEDKGDEFTFGKFIRLLIIIAIILAILLFFGSQIMQISKSME